MILHPPPKETGSTDGVGQTHWPETVGHDQVISYVKGNT